MVREISRSVVLPAPLGARAGVGRAMPPIGIIPVWHDALRTFSAHAIPILICASIGFALPSALSALIDVRLNGNQPPALCPFRALPDWPWLVPLLASALFVPLTSGIIARLALDSTQQGCGLCVACVAALKRLPALA